MSAELPFEYSQRRSSLLRDLLNAQTPEDRETALQAIEEGDRELEDYLAHMPSGGGVSSWCHQENYHDMPSGSGYDDPGIAVVTIPRSVGDKVLLTWTFELTFVGGSSPFFNHNVEIYPYYDGNPLSYNAWVESDTNSASIVFSSVVSGSYLVEIPAGDGDFEVGILIRNTGYADCQMVNAFVTAVNVGTSGGTADCLIIGSS